LLAAGDVAWFPWVVLVTALPMPMPTTRTPANTAALAMFS